MSTVKNPSPKVRFQETPAAVTKHRDMVASTAFEVAADFAMLNYVARLGSNLSPTNTTFNEYATLGVKVCGALEYLQEMRLLGESRPAAATNPNDNLDHRA